MAREDWRDLESERLRRLRDRDRDDYGQADYSDRYAYDPEHRTGYRVDRDERWDRRDERRPLGEVRAYDENRRYDEGRYRDDPPRHDDRRRADAWADRRNARRDGPSDRVLWAVITERLEDERRLDLSDVEVDVRNGEVILNGTVRRKADKRRIEDVADVDGVVNVQNNLRVREQHRRWMFL